MASHGTGTRHGSDVLLERLRDQFPELSGDDLARAAVGVEPLPDLHRREPAVMGDAPVAATPPRHRA